MKKIRTELLLAAALPLAGCIPMEQASLVYSSKSEIGVGVTAGAPDSPGFDVHIGYKALDAAFVPVVVAKHCYTATQCSGVNYNITTVSGRNDLSGQSTLDDKLIADTSKAIEDNIRLIDSNSNRLSLINQDLKRIEGLPGLETELRGLTIDPAAEPDRTLSGPEEARKATLTAEIPAIKGLDANALKAERTKLEASNGTQAKELVDNKRKLDQLLARKNEQSAEAKVDAYSVYGTFSGNAGGNRDGANLSAGKVFSTGIAAQNLSQGVSASEKARAMTLCLQATETLLNNPKLAGDDKAKVRDRIARMCGIEVKDD